MEKRLKKALTECKTQDCKIVAKKYGYTYNQLMTLKQKHGVKRENYRWTDAENRLIKLAQEMQEIYSWRNVAKELKVPLKTLLTHKYHLFNRSKSNFNKKSK